MALPLHRVENMHARLLEHASLLWQPEVNDASPPAHEVAIGQIPTMNLLRIHSLESPFSPPECIGNAVLCHQQLRLTVVISSLR